jgi:hypothetical protein
MPENILRGTIKIDAPGVKETLTQVEQGVSSMKKTLAPTNGVTVIGQMKDQVEQFRRALKLATDPRDTETLTKGINTLNSQIRQIERAGNPLKGFHVGVLQSERTLSGFDGVIRNVTEGTGNLGTTMTGLLENFLRLRTETGGTKKAFEILSHELLSGGGLIIGLGLAIPLIEALGEKLFSSGDSAEEMKKHIDELTKSIEYLNEESARIRDLDFSQNAIDVEQLKSTGADAQTIYKKTLDGLIHQRESFQNKINELGSRSTNIVTNEGFDLKKYQEMKETGEELKGVFAQYDIIYKDQLKAEKEYYDNEQKIQILGLQNDGRIREEGLKNQKDAEEKAKKQRKEDLENLKKYLEERSKIISEFSKDFAALGQQSLPLFKDDPVNNELKKRLQTALDKLIDLKLPELNIKIKLNKKETEKEIADNLKAITNEIKGIKAPTITVNVNTSLIKDYEEFKAVGERIGRAIGAGFDETFKKIFDEAFKNAIESGLSGKELENFKSKFEAISVVASQGISGIANSFGALTDAILQGKNGMQAFGQALKGTFRSIAVEIVKDIVLAGILSALSGGASGGGMSFIKAFGSILGGSHASGLKRVPKDGYIAELHKDEMVVPARQSGFLRSIMNSDFSIPSIKTPSIPSTNFAKFNNSNIVGMGSRSLEVTVAGELTARGDHLVSVVNKENRKQKIAF